jgi:hypothetical protein
MIATSAPTGVVLVANHRGYAPADDVLNALAAGSVTADVIGDEIDRPTRDVVATLNMLAAGENPLVRRRVIAVQDGSARDGWYTTAAQWELT